ncbi:MAG: guanylate kinase [Candidatus Lambdaproteobacteria bacterium]|nr:guanylate kinase [Candidatus Lambdaproteobacteria bacterium]
MSQAHYPRVFVVSGPSGVGKSSIIKAAMRAVPELRLSVSLTTRAPRPGEWNGRDYIFVTKSQFEAQIRNRMFLEWARVFDNYYGTSRKQVEEILAANCHALLDVDTQGAMQIQEKTRGAVYIFIRPPSLRALRVRLEARNTETPEKIAKRLSMAQHEISYAHRYNHIVINDDLDRAVGQFLGIIRGEALQPEPFLVRGSPLTGTQGSAAASGAAPPAGALAEAAPPAPLPPTGAPAPDAEALLRALGPGYGASLHAELMALVHERIQAVVARELDGIVEETWRAVAARGR